MGGVATSGALRLRESERDKDIHARGEARRRQHPALPRLSRFHCSHGQS